MSTTPPPSNSKGQFPGPSGQNWNMVQATVTADISSQLGFSKVLNISPSEPASGRHLRAPPARRLLDPRLLRFDAVRQYFGPPPIAATGIPTTRIRSIRDSATTQGLPPAASAPFPQAPRMMTAISPRRPTTAGRRSFKTSIPTPRARRPFTRGAVDLWHGSRGGCSPDDQRRLNIRKNACRGAQRPGQQLVL